MSYMYSRMCGGAWGGWSLGAGAVCGLDSWAVFRRLYVQSVASVSVTAGVWCVRGGPQPTATRDSRPTHRPGETVSHVCVRRWSAEREMCRESVCSRFMSQTNKRRKEKEKRAIHFRSSQSRSYGAAPLAALPRHEVAVSLDRPCRQGRPPCCTAAACIHRRRPRRLC